MNGSTNRTASTRWIRSLPALCAAGSLAISATPSAVLAAGYDTPNLYSARHIGMGGTAVSYVRDASALFHNPAGLGNVKQANVIGNFTLLLANLDGTPSALPSANSITSELIVAPVPLVGGAYRITDWLVVGAAFYPVASTGAQYKYDGGPAGELTDESQLLFLETSPGVAINLPEEWGLGKINFGFSYRIIYAQLVRSIDSEVAGNQVDIDLDGASYQGYRLGLQWSPIDELSFGFHYRSKTTTELTSDEGTITQTIPGVGPLTLPVNDISGEIILPARLSFGARGDYANIGIAVDAEYGFQSQNRRLAINGDVAVPMVGPVPSTLTNVFQWEDAWTVRVGGEYKIELESLDLMPRVGYIFDDQVTVAAYPNAFGTSPVATHTFTTGLGVDFGSLELAVAYSYRVGDTTIEITDLANPATGAEVCDFCGGPGDYRTEAHGLYVDVTYDFE